MKKTIILLWIIISFWVSFWWFCEDTSQEVPPKDNICNNAPQWLENYIENTAYILNQIDTNKKAQWPSWLWSKAWQTPKWAIEVSSLFVWLWLWNFFQNFEVIFEDKHIIRDWVRITNLKVFVSNYFLESSWNWILNKNIENIDEIKNKIKSTDSYILEWEFKTYKEVLIYIYSNQNLIESIYFEEVVSSWIWDITNINNNEYIKKIKLNNNKYTKYKLNKEKLKKYILQIRKSYYKNHSQKVSWQKIECAKTWSEFIKSINNIVCNIWTDKVNEATERFSCNYNRLKEVLWMGWWENKNCWSVQEKDWVSMEDRVQANGDIEDEEELNEMWKMFKSIPWNIKNWLADYYNSYSTWYRKFENTASIKIGTLKSNMKNTSNKIIKDKDKLNNIITKIESSNFTHNTTKTFPQISQKIHNIIDILNEKNDDWWTILDNTATACENQSPFNWRCRP